MPLDTKKRGTKNGEMKIMLVKLDALSSFLPSAHQLTNFRKACGNHVSFVTREQDRWISTGLKDFVSISTIEVN